MNKHPDDYVFGLDKEVQDKMQAKFDPEKQKVAAEWIMAVTEEQMVDDFGAWLKDGQVLCRLVNKINKKHPQYKANFRIKKIYDGKMPFKIRENICFYLNTCKKMGMKEIDCFVSQDLYEGDNLVAVIDQIHSLGAHSRKVKNFEGPMFGIKHADENVREFSQETLNKGKAFVPLQNAGSIEVEKSKGTDSIKLYGKVGDKMGESVGGISQQNAGSIAVEKSKGTDHIVKYGIVGQEMGKSAGGVSQQNAGSIAIEKEKGTDSIVQYGKVGQDMGKSAGGVSQQNAGSVETSKDKKLDNISRALN